MHTSQAGESRAPEAPQKAASGPRITTQDLPEWALERERERKGGGGGGSDYPPCGCVGGPRASTNDGSGPKPPGTPWDTLSHLEWPRRPPIRWMNLPIKLIVSYRVALQSRCEFLTKRRQPPAPIQANGRTNWGPWDKPLAAGGLPCWLDTFSGWRR